MLRSVPLVPTPVPCPPPTPRMLGDYLVVEKIAEGGFGEVYEAIAPCGRSVALKVPLVNDERALRDFQREVEIVRDLDHPNVVPILEADFIDGVPTIVYPLGDMSIAAIVDDGLWPAAGLEFSQQLLEGLAHVHQRGYLHCDLKPSNLIVLPGDTLGITDFGLARAQDDAHLHTTSGTADYMAPEHREDGRVSTRSDVYEAAVVIVEMLSGWVVTNPLELDLESALPRSRRLRALAPVLRRALQLNPRARFLDGAAFAHAFRQVTRGASVH